MMLKIRVHINVSYKETWVEILEFLFYAKILQKYYRNVKKMLHDLKILVINGDCDILLSNIRGGIKNYEKIFNDVFMLNYII